MLSSELHGEALSGGLCEAPTIFNGVPRLQALQEQEVKKNLPNGVQTDI